jgi:hypothetical protein
LETNTGARVEPMVANVTDGESISLLIDAVHAQFDQATSL